MGTITARKKADGSLSYTAQIRIRRDGKLVHSEAQTFERKPAATAWLRKREKELEAPDALERARGSEVTLGRIIGQYVEESKRAIGKTKTQVLQTIIKSDLAAMPCDRIESRHIVEYLQSFTVQPQTVGNYASHLAAVFAVARPAWGYPLDERAMDDALTVCKRLGVIGRSKQRDRRPTLAELEALLDHFTDRKRRVPQAMPMAIVILFALFSARRQEEIVSIRWKDFDAEHSRILVRDMKHPGEKAGNDVWVDLPAPARRIIEAMPRKKDQIFPYSTDATSANFTRAARLLGIEDLHFHDLRHEGISRLFEMGLSIPHVAAVSGHRSWNSLKRYTHLRHVGDRYANWSYAARYMSDPEDENEPQAPSTAMRTK